MLLDVFFFHRTNEGRPSLPMTTVMQWRTRTWKRVWMQTTMECCTPKWVVSLSPYLPLYLHSSSPSAFFLHPLSYIHVCRTSTVHVLYLYMLPFILPSNCFGRQFCDLQFLLSCKGMHNCTSMNCATPSPPYPCIVYNLTEIADHQKMYFHRTKISQCNKLPKFDFIRGFLGVFFAASINDVYNM